MSRHGQWQVTDESPGRPGDPEIWVDEAWLDAYTRGSVRLRGELIGAIVRAEQPAPGGTVVYRVISRRWSQANDGRPYYVLAWPDLPRDPHEGVPDG